MRCIDLQAMIAAQQQRITLAVVRLAVFAIYATERPIINADTIIVNQAFALTFISHFLVVMLLLWEVLNRDIATLLALEVLQWVCIPLCPRSATTHDVDSIVQGVAHRLLISNALARDVIRHTVVWRCTHRR